MREPGAGAAAALSALIAVALLALTPVTTLWDRDEPRFAQAAVEMAASGDYLVPTFNGELRAQKPPLVYWLMTASLHVFGAREIAVRFWSPVGIAVAALATFFIGRRLWSARVGLWAMAILALTPMTLIEGVAATSDALLLASITVSVALISGMLQEGTRVQHFLPLTLALGAGLLIKGPVALVLPIGTAIGVLLLARRDPPPTRGGLPLLMMLAAASLVGTALYLAWLVPAASATNGEIVRRGLFYENVERFLHPFEGHGTPLVVAPFYYPFVIAVAFLPWTPRLLAAGRHVATAGIRTQRVALVAAWIGVPVIAFTLAATKLPHYVFPAWPALALAVAASFAGEPDERVARVRFLRTLIAAGVTVLIIVAGALVIDRLKPVPRIAPLITASTIAGALYTYEFEEPSLAFYTGRRLARVTGAAALVAWAHQPAAAILVAPRSALAEVERAHGPLPLVEIGSAHGWNIANGDQLELVAFVRRSGG